MSESRVTVRVNGNDYPMACEPGEEEKVAALGRRLDEVVRKVSINTGPIAESRLLVMAALVIADSLSELEDAGEGAAGKAPEAVPVDTGAGKELADRLENLAVRLERLASGAV